MLYHYNKLIVISFLILILSLAITPYLYSQELIYKVGDWIKYRISIDYPDHGINCIILVTIGIKNIDNTIVTFEATEVKLEKGDEVCSYFVQSIKLSLNRTSINVMNADPESGGFLINPSYTGKYNASTPFVIGEVQYHKGVLVKLTNKYGQNIINIELIGTSILELSHQQSSPMPMWIIAIVVVIVTVVVIIIVLVLLITMRKKVITAQPPQPAQLPQQPPPQSPSPTS